MPLVDGPYVQVSQATGRRVEPVLPSSGLRYFYRYEGQTMADRGKPIAVILHRLAIRPKGKTWRAQRLNQHLEFVCEAQEQVLGVDQD